MPRYFFHVFDVEWYRDHAGEELTDVSAMREQAEQVGRKLLEDEEGVSDPHSRIEVADEHGNIVHVVRLLDVTNK
jgi:hypothetical protein